MSSVRSVASVVTASAVVLLVLTVLTLAPTPTRADEVFTPSAEAMSSAQRGAKMIRLAPLRGDRELKVSVWAAEPMVANGVSLQIDERGRVFVVESARDKRVSVLDSRARHTWPSEAFRAKASPERMANITTELLDVDLASRTVEDREKMMRTYFEGDLARFTSEPEVLKRLVDNDGDGVADTATTVSTWQGLMNGVMAGVLVRRGDIFVTNIPSVYRLRDDNDDGKADKREELSRGYGVRWAFHGHDLHGLRIGPDGRLYFSVGDRGATVKTKEGGTVSAPETGSVFRCDLDGSNLEIVHTGLRNPQELAFDDFGNLFTGDNNSDGGDKARIVQIVEGGDSGWRIGYQNHNHPGPRGPWISEQIDTPAGRLRPAAYVPPVANLTNGPSGFTYHPGTGTPSAFKGHFLLADFKGQASRSGIWAFRLKQKGAGFTMLPATEMAWGVLATDVEAAPDGSLYLLDYVVGWLPTGTGRVLRVIDQAGLDENAKYNVKALIASDMDSLARREPQRALELMRHPDQRIRQEAQFALASAGDVETLWAASRDGNQLTRLHGVWGLSQLARRAKEMQSTEHLLTLLGDRDPEVRAQAARGLGDARVKAAEGKLIAGLADRNARVQFFSAIALGALGKPTDARAWDATLAMLARNRDRDPYLRHAGVMSLLGGHGKDAIAQLAGHRSQSVRLAAVVALKRLGDPGVQRFLSDKDPQVVREAARAINDARITQALPALAARADAKTLRDLPIAIRIVAAAARVGGPVGAEQLGRVASDPRAVLAARVDAINALTDWPSPPNRNRVTGLYEPHDPPRRDPAMARTVLGAFAEKLLARDQDAVVIATARAAGRLGLTAAGPALVKLAQKQKAPLKQRREALEALDTLNDPAMDKVLSLAAQDEDASLRLTALRMQVARQPERAIEQATRALEDRAQPVKQTAIAILGAQDSAQSLQILTGLMDKLVAEKLDPGLALDVLEAARKKTGNDKKHAALVELQKRLDAYEAKRPADDLGPFKEVLVGGNAARGRDTFFEHEQVQCRRCHSIEGHDTMVGPELLGIGKKRDRSYLLEAVVFPSKHFAPGFESVMLTMRDGAIHGGTLKRETNDILDLDSVDEGQLQLEKRLVADRERGVSGMPEGFGYILTKTELRDLIEFLATN